MIKTMQIAIPDENKSEQISLEGIEKIYLNISPELELTKRADAHYKRENGNLYIDVVTYEELGW